MVSVELLLLLTAVCAVLFAIGVQIHLVFAFWAIVAAYLDPFVAFQNMAVIVESELRSFQLAAVPLFIVVGAMIGTFGGSKHIVRFAKSLGGWLPGSLGNTVIYTAGIFAAITGSNTATTAAVGEALHDELVEEGYDPEFAAATVASGGTLGVIIPPSAMLILYGVYFNISIPQLFLAGVIPGILMLLSLSVVCTIISYRNGYRSAYEFSFREVIFSAWLAKNAIITIVILLGGIFAGIFTPSESATAAFFYLAIAEVTRSALSPWVRRLGWDPKGEAMAVDEGTNPNLSPDNPPTDRAVRRGTAEPIASTLRNSVYGVGNTLRKMRRPFSLTVTLLGIIMPIFVNTIMIQQTLSLMGHVDAVGNFVAGLPSTHLTMVAIVVILLISGSVMASVPNMVLVAPMLAPAADSIGLTPLMWGIVFMMSDSIGFITPPYGLNLYVISSLTGIDYMRVAVAALPYLVSLFLIFVMFLVYPQANFLVT